MDPIVILGFGTGAISAVRTIMANSKEPDIVVIEKRSFDTYSPCGMPYVVEGLSDHEELKHEFPGGNRLQKFLSSEAVKIDPANRTVRIRRGEEEEEIKYSSLLLDTGSRPVVPPVPMEKSLMGRGVYTFSTPEDVDLLLDAMEDVEKVAVVGAGAIGLELAQAFAHNNKKVFLLERMEQPLPGILDKDIGKAASKVLPDSIETMFSTPLEAVVGKDKVEAVTAAGKDIEVDAVVLSIGVAPDTSLARDAGLDVSKMGVVVDKNMRTSNPHIFAVGDCIQGTCRITGDASATRLAPPAFVQGRVAALNMVGQQAVYKGSARAFVTVIGGQEFAAAGLSSSAVNGKTGKATVKRRPTYIGDQEDVTVKLVAEASGKIVGVQAYGPGSADIVNRIVVAMDAEMTVFDLLSMEFAYCPPVNDIFDPVMMAAEKLARRIGG